MSTLEVAILMGGPSPEHDVSLASAQVVCEGIPRAHFRVRPVLLRRDLKWALTEEPVGPDFDVARLTDSRPAPLGQAMEALAACDVAFLAIHGAYGEDGRLQGLLECLGVPYTGSHVEGSALAINKILTKALLTAADAPHAPYQVVRRGPWQGTPSEIVADLEASLGRDLVVKSPTKGSSFGVHMIRRGEGLTAALDEVLATEDVALVEAWVTGREVSCGVLEAADGLASALPPTEIIPPEGRAFDFDAKYTPGVTREVTPPDMPAAWLEEIQTRALQVHQLLGLRGLSRTDMMVCAQGRVTILEVNTIPGLTRTSLFPQAAAIGGVALPDLLSGILRTAIANHPFPRNGTRTSHDGQ